LPPARVEAAIVRIKEALPTQPYAFNLLHSPKKLVVEDATVDLYLKHGIRTVEASSYVGLTPSIVRYRLAGLLQRSDGAIVIGHRVIVKLSRVELAAQFMQPAPPAMVQHLLESGRISPLQAELAQHVPIADDVTVEADSGGHTDSRPLVSLLPAMLKLRDEIQQQRRYPAPVRVGAAGGIATPQAVLAAFMMGADYVVTGSVNQSCVEAGTSLHVKELLATLSMTDVAMAPEADMFEQGVRVQVAKQRSLFPMRAQKLFDCYQHYDGLEAIPEPERRFLERQIFRDSLDNIWRQTTDYLSVNKPEQLTRAADPKVKMALLFKWYLGQTSRWAADGHSDRQLDYQVWCGPAMGAFNAWAGGTYLEIPENRRVADIARVLMSEAACLYRLNLLKMHGFAGLTGVN
jgi:trans-AT polyketide synthase/acyltransferase/oxidoreductase domain-containing protein